jgi:hypothetical protein
MRFGMGCRWATDSKTHCFAAERSNQATQSFNAMLALNRLFSGFLFILLSRFPTQRSLFRRFSPVRPAAQQPRTPLRQTSRARPLQIHARRHPAEALEMPREMALVEETDFSRDHRPWHARKQQSLCTLDPQPA